MPEESILKAEQLSFTYPDGTNALKGIDVEIKRGKKIACMGANGSGKSTFFLCLNGIHKPDGGRLFFCNAPYRYSRKELLAIRQKVGIVFQNPDHQIFSSNVMQEIAFGLLNLGIDQHSARISVDQIMEELQISAFKEKPTHFLSGGQKKQVSIADILVMEPEVLILDEPFASLDPLHTTLIRTTIDHLNEKGLTLLIATHDPDYALEWADEVLLFHQGTLLAQGPPESIFKDTELLLRCNLKQPHAMRLFHTLCSKGLLDTSLPIPRSLEKLESYIYENS